jgi:hypothetical protein
LHLNYLTKSYLLPLHYDFYILFLIFLYFFFYFLISSFCFLNLFFIFHRRRRPTPPGPRRPGRVRPCHGSRSDRPRFAGSRGTTPTRPAATTDCG